MKFKNLVHQENNHVLSCLNYTPYEATPSKNFTIVYKDTICNCTYKWFILLSKYLDLQLVK